MSLGFAKEGGGVGRKKLPQLVLIFIKAELLLETGLSLVKIKYFGLVSIPFLSRDGFLHLKIKYSLTILLVSIHYNFFSLKFYIKNHFLSTIKIYSKHNYNPFKDY